MCEQGLYGVGRKPVGVGIRRSHSVDVVRQGLLERHHDPRAGGDHQSPARRQEAFSALHHAPNVGAVFEYPEQGNNVEPIRAGESFRRAAIVRDVQPRHACAVGRGRLNTERRRAAGLGEFQKETLTSAYVTHAGQRPDLVQGLSNEQMAGLHVGFGGGKEMIAIQVG